MEALHIELKPPFPWRRVVAWVVVVALVAASVALAHANWQVREEIAALRKGKADMEARIEADTKRRAQEAPSPALIEALAPLVATAQFPLDAALTALEQVDVPGAQLVSLEINATEHRALAVFEASSAVALQAVIQALAESGPGNQWTLETLSSTSATATGSSQDATLHDSTRVVPGEPMGRGAGVSRAQVLTAGAQPSSGGVRASFRWSE